ncbi:hypothetical protein [Pelagibacterium sp.]|uniref:hypothetical protein n=1 Tax=Pelagibacterium sp. TaxID=1967288 RepID=UPI003A93BA33
MTDMSVIHLTDEARTILGAAFEGDPACKDAIVLPGRWDESEGLIDLFITGVPSGRATHSRGAWMPRREDVVELVRRVINSRSRHWDHARPRPLPMPRDWWRAVRDEFDFIDNIPECASGWADLLIGMSGWLQEQYDGAWKTSQIKEKFGGLRIYHDCGDDRSEEVISVAEWLSEFICEDCGAPGRLLTRGGWCRTVCDGHAADGGFE